jgi:hypothetical protein
MDIHEINDVRSDKEFRGISFSGFNKTQVKTELLNSIVATKVEPACYWATELVCSGHFVELWDIVITYVSRYVHLGCPKLPLYISLRIEAFKDIMSNGYVGNELSLRNNEKIRHLFAEVIATLCYARNKHRFVAVKIKKSEEFSMAIVSTKLKAPNVSYAEIGFKKEDPKELFIAINELSYHLSKESSNGYSACYWLEWLIEFDAICRKRKQTLVAERRSWSAVQDNYQKNSIWVVWDVVKARTQEKGCHVTSKIVDALFDMFCLRYTCGVAKRRKYLIYNCISLLTEKVDMSIPIWTDKKAVMNVVSKINTLYKDIKKNEKAPATGYLFNGVERSNLDKTRERLEMMNQMMSGTM